MVSFHILLLDRAGNNLVNADFSPYLRHIFAVKHIYLTLYIVYTYHVTSTYSVPAGSNARARVAVLAALAVCAAVPVCACRYLVNGGLFSPPSLCGLPCLSAFRVRVGARVRACACALSAYFPVACRAFYSPIMYILRRYARLARRVSAPPQTFSRSFSSRRYLSRRRPRGRETRFYIAMRAVLWA